VASVANSIAPISSVHLWHATSLEGGIPSMTRELEPTDGIEEPRARDRPAILTVLAPVQEDVRERVVSLGRAVDDLGVIAIEEDLA
jgi:hypothetical protein